MYINTFPVFHSSSFFVSVTHSLRTNTNRFIILPMTWTFQQEDIRTSLLSTRNRPISRPLSWFLYEHRVAGFCFSFFYFLSFFLFAVELPLMLLKKRCVQAEECLRIYKRRRKRTGVRQTFPFQHLDPTFPLVTAWVSVFHFPIFYNSSLGLSSFLALYSERHI